MSSISAREATVVSSVTRGLTSTLSPPELLHLAARLARRLLEARRATILLLDDHGCLVPEVSVARDADEELFARFRDMAPISLHDSPDAWAVLQTGHVLLIPRAAESTVVPEAWRDAFGLQALAIAPLVLEGEPCGALVVESEHLGVRSTPSMVRAMGSIAAMTAMAVGGARRRRSDSARLLELQVVHQACRDLSGAGDVADVAEIGLDALMRLTGAVAGSVLVVDGENAVDVLARRNPLAQPVDHARLLELAAAGTAVCAPAGDPDAMHTLAVPLPLGDDGHGLCALSVRPEGCPPTERLVLAQMLGHALGVELRRAARERDADLMEQCREALRVATASLEGEGAWPEIADLIAVLAGILRWGAGWEPLGVLATAPRLASALQLTRATGAAAGALRSWRRAPGTAAPVVMGETMLVPLVAGRVVPGALQLRVFERAPLGHDRTACLEVIAAGLTDVLLRTQQRLAAEAAATELAGLREWRAQVRTRAAQASPGGETETSHLGARLGEPAWLTSRPLHVSFARAVAAHVAETVRPQARVLGSARPLPLATEMLLRRLVAELVGKLGERSRAQHLVAELRYRDTDVELLLRDDGVPLALRSGGATQLFASLRALAWQCDEAGGRLLVTNVDPLGVQVEASLPLTAPGSSADTRTDRTDRTVVLHPAQLKELS